MAEKLQSDCQNDCPFKDREVLGGHCRSIGLPSHLAGDPIRYCGVVVNGLERDQKMTVMGSPDSERLPIFSPFFGDPITNVGIAQSGYVIRRRFLQDF